MAEVRIEHWTYETGTYNKHTAHSYQAQARDDVTGEVIGEGPIRDDRESAKDDARQLRQQYGRQE